MATKKTASTNKPVRSSAKAKRPIFDADTASRKSIRARYDVSRTTDENENLWKGVDSLSAAEANSPNVRRTIRNRARYETANNSYACGIVDTLAADTVGPEVQLQLGDTDLSQRTEQDFMRWAKAVDLWAKVRTARRAKTVDGEVFGMLVTNRNVANRVKLDLRLIECDMVESWCGMQNEQEIDGIRFDEWGNPTAYRVLSSHPGDYRRFMKSQKGNWINAEYIIHYFRAVRPGQVRGISEITPALSLFGELRQFTKAVIMAASRAAEISGVMQTTLLPENVAAELSDPLTMIEIARNNLISLPEGWTMAQLKAEQPATTYKMFKQEIINEAARCVSMPYNIAAGNSSEYNYASGRMDHQTYDGGIRVERAELDHDVLDRVYAAWLAEYQTLSNMTVAQMYEVLDHEWHYAGRGHVDPLKEANADKTRLENGTLTRARYWAKHGADHKRETAQWIKERVEAEVEWNNQRESAGLAPAPFESGEGRKMMVDEVEEPAANDKNKGTEDEG